MKNFRKLKGCGLIVFVPNPEKEGKIIHGCNLNSPNLTVKNYGEEKFDAEWMKQNAELKMKEIKQALKSPHFYNLPEDWEQHQLNDTAFMYSSINKIISGKSNDSKTPYYGLPDLGKKS